MLLLKSYNTQVIVAQVVHFTFSKQPQVLIVVFGKEHSDSSVVFETVALVRSLRWNVAECLFAESGRFIVDMVS